MLCIQIHIQTILEKLASLQKKTLEQAFRDTSLGVNVFYCPTSSKFGHWVAITSFNRKKRETEEGEEEEQADDNNNDDDDEAEAEAGERGLALADS